MMRFRLIDMTERETLTIQRLGNIHSSRDTNQWCNVRSKMNDSQTPQFAFNITVCCILQRCKSLVIHLNELFHLKVQISRRCRPFGQHQMHLGFRCGNDPSAGSPTETLLRLHLPLNGKVYSTFRNMLKAAAVRRLHRTIQSVGATGGVYKGQGRNQCKLMTCVYQEFLVGDQQLQGSIPITTKTQRFPMSIDKGRLVDSVIVARVRPRTSKGITDLLLPQTSFR